jgi:prolyl-tRNA synthetase
MTDETVVQQAETVYRQLMDAGYSALLDDRDASPGVKLKDADLVGLPVQVVVSPRNLAKGTVEVKNRWSGERRYVKPGDLEPAVEDILAASRNDNAS